MKFSPRLLLVLGLCGLWASPRADAQSVPALQMQPGPGVQKLVARAKALRLQKQFARAQRLLDAQLGQHPNAADTTALQKALADVHFAWGQQLKLSVSRRIYLKGFSWSGSELEKAAAHLQQAYATDKLLRPQKSADDLLEIGLCYQSGVLPQESTRFFQLALPLYRNAKNLRGEADVLRNLADNYTASDRNEEALRLLNQALLLDQKTKNRHGEGRDWLLLALGNAMLGSYEDALKAGAKSLAIFRELDDTFNQMIVLGNTGWTYGLLNRHQESLEPYQQAVALARITKDPRGPAFVLRTQTDLATAYVGLKRYPEALRIFTTILPLQRKAKDVWGESLTLDYLASVHMKMGRYGEAQRIYTLSLPLHRSNDDSWGEGQSQSGIGTALFKLNRLPQALRAFNQALPIHRKAGDRACEATTLGYMSSIYARQKQPGVAILYGKQSVNLIQSIRRDIMGLDQATKDAFLQSNQDTYRNLARLLIEAGRFSEAEAVLSMLQQNEFLQFVRRSPRGPQMEQVRAEMNSGEKPVVAEQDQRLARVAQLSKEQWELSNLDNPTAQQSARLSEVQKQLSASKTQLDAFFATMPTRFGRNAEDVKTDSTQLSAMQPLLRKLGGHAAQVSTFVDDNGLDVLLTMPSGPTIHLSYPASDAKTGGKPFPAWLNTRIYEFVQSIEAGANADNTPQVNNLATELNNILSCHGALHNQLQGTGINTLMWRLSGPLRALPLVALRDSDGYWVEKYQNVILTSGSSDLNLSDKPDGTGDSWRALGLGVTKAWTVKGDQFPALSGVKGELQAVINAPTDGFSGGVIPGHILEDGDFTQNTFFRSLRGATPDALVPWQVIHIASHFKVSGDASQSFLLLGDGQALTLAALHERAGNNPLFPGVELMTLSACQTAQGADSLGALAEENGAKSVLATLWPVADQETAQLMGTFYSTYSAQRDQGKASALQQAQLALLRSGKASARPYFWAPFVLMGNWK